MDSIEPSQQMSDPLTDAESVRPDFRVLLVSGRAAARIVKASAAEEPGTVLRVSVSGGGCSGYQYAFDLTTERFEDDHLFERDGATVAIDDASLDLLTGSELDFVETLSGATFEMRNPNAASTCGCGMSFSLA